MAEHPADSGIRQVFGFEQLAELGKGYIPIPKSAYFGGQTFAAVGVASKVVGLVQPIMKQKREIIGKYTFPFCPFLMADLICSFRKIGMQGREGFCVFGEIFYLLAQRACGKKIPGGTPVMMLAASSAEAHRNHGGGEAKQGFDVLHTEDVVGGVKKTGGDLLRKCGGSGLGIAVPGTNVGAQTETKIL